jgi:hypothetical protein
MRFIQSNYNSVSRGQPTIIQGFQLKISSQSRGMRAASYRTQEPCSCCHPRFQWYATPVVNLLPYTAQWRLMIDYDQARYSSIQVFPVLQFRCTWNNWLNLQQRNPNQGNKFELFILFLSKALMRGAASLLSFTV